MAPPTLSPGSARSGAEIVERIRHGGAALVALSGGVDSGVVAALAFEALGAQAMAVTLTGPSVSRAEVDRAVEVARRVGIDHHLVAANPLERAEYRANPADRCYFCRSVEGGRLREFGEAHGVRRYLDGVHLDDLSDDRPGLRAMEEAGFEHPLLWGGWTKADVRREARARRLPNAEQPSDACLASRVAHGDPIDAELLARIEAAESVLLDRGFRRVRVRVRAGSARIEVDPNEVLRLTTPEMSAEVLTQVADLGFSPVSIDPVGYGGARRAPREGP
ncbi:MAG TPA: ATP-dependent sacrificial sulfur transferase LarE [Thermoplasmata archaeon]|nr:ATP-dependent sacrificial sulfur transferase LarE [Thermoplasmata archaeon]